MTASAAAVVIIVEEELSEALVSPADLSASLIVVSRELSISASADFEAPTVDESCGRGQDGECVEELHSYL
jgi:hypothetical protein